MNSFSRLALAVGLAFHCLALSSNAYALSSFSASDLSFLTQEMVDDLVKTVAIGAEHRAYMPASPMGLIIGLDLGIEATVIRLPNNFKSTIASASGESVGNVPALVPIPKLNAHKGLPFAIDVGMSYISYLDKVKVIGGDLKWAFSDLIKAMPFSAAVRLSLTSEKLWYIKATTWQTDFLISKNLLLLEPYFGTGLQFWSGSLEVPTNLPANLGLPSAISGSSSGTNVHFFGGIPLKLGLIWLTTETDYSTTGVWTFGTKLSFNF